MLKEVEIEKWKAIKASRSGPEISHMMHVDDLLFFAEANLEHVEVIKQCVARFDKTSGQNVNFAKSRIYFSPNVSMEAAKKMSMAVGMLQTKDLGKYLGARLIHHRWNNGLYEELIGRFNKRMSGWKTKCLSLTGRATLAKSVLSSLPIYQMQFTKLPKTALHEIDKMTRRFVWGGDE